MVARVALPPGRLGEILAKKIVDAEKDDAGLSSATKRKHAKQSLNSHADDWKAVLLAKGRTKKHARGIAIMSVGV